ncbi:MAG: lyase family protein, partial [Thermoplasmata archaeon]
NAHPRYPELAIAEVARQTGLPFRLSDNLFEAMQNTDAAVEVSGALKTLAVSLIKIANDIRLLSSGPRTGLGEIRLPPVQPGSSIMPGKVNPVMAEMLNMAAFQILGNDATITYAAQAGQLELNVMMPVIAYNLLHAIQVGAGGVGAFTERAVRGIEVDRERCQSLVEWSTAMATALSPHIGYHRAAEIAQQAFAEGKTVRDVAIAEGVLSDEELDELLDADRMTRVLEK